MRFVAHVRWQRLPVFILLLALLSGLGCHGKSAQDGASENELLEFFKQELALIKEFQAHKEDAYMNYLRYQMNHYEQKEGRLNYIIKQVNENFSQITVDEKVRYQRHWLEQFQPVVNEMVFLTRKLIVEETAQLNQDKMASIQEFTIRLKEKEKKTKKMVLEPVFFHESEEDGL